MFIYFCVINVYMYIYILKITPLYNDYFVSTAFAAKSILNPVNRPTLLGLLVIISIVS